MLRSAYRQLNMGYCRMLAIDVTIGGKADMTYCTAHVRFRV